MCVIRDDDVFERIDRTTFVVSLPKMNRIVHILRQLFGDTENDKWEYINFKWFVYLLLLVSLFPCCPTPCWCISVTCSRLSMNRFWSNVPSSPIPRFFLLSLLNRDIPNLFSSPRIKYFFLQFLVLSQNSCGVVLFDLKLTYICRFTYFWLCVLFLRTFVRILACRLSSFVYYCRFNGHVTATLEHNRLLICTPRLWVSWFTFQNLLPCNRYVRNTVSSDAKRHTHAKPSTIHCPVDVETWKKGGLMWYCRHFLLGAESS